MTQWQETITLEQAIHMNRLRASIGLPPQCPFVVAYAAAWARAGLLDRQA